MAALVRMQADASLLLDGHIVQEGDRLALRIFDAWVEGEARKDHTGWYVLTTAQACIRLAAGLTASFVETQQETNYGTAWEPLPDRTTHVPESRISLPDHHPGH